MPTRDGLKADFSGDKPADMKTKSVENCAEKATLVEISSALGV
jgi:hypothetical protein